MKKYYIITGEASGDLHAANLMRGILKEDQNVDFRYWGGDNMANVYGKPVKHISELAFMGFVEVVANLGTILSNIKFCKKDILDYKPDALILVDYPGFNLRIAKWAKSQGIKVIYYISPQIWAWKQNRVHTIKKVVDKMLVILPFEKEFYAKFDMEVTYVGHPLLDAIEQFRAKTDKVDLYQKHNLDERPVIALLPGSRKQEINTKLPIMLDSLSSFDDYQFVIAGAPALPDSFYEPFLKHSKNVRLIHGETYDLLSISTAALVTSGTATLETALFEVPEVVCYKGSSISYHIAKRLIKVDYISLVNLILQKEAVKELIQHECNAKLIEKELKLILPGGAKQAQMEKDYAELISILGKGGASETAALEIINS
ncbi:lipid-A-disaccharide synthase [Brumimicrobium aurantiacum]|uniref:Lipid-A-disaccharide synthase n=1 Tax=Brumimicrobium aurantiacum TaxID=1737063 RepID=A0A3E1EWD5_9FLAO|nr:lipid-A-disaccharide synthase [Brumimicrobium aurantiacum]RFC53870.1 lipid-A-disaccharide synthase [Brumimicrobium aurantiacum]